MLHYFRSMNIRFYILTFLVFFAASGSAQDIAQVDLQALSELDVLVSRHNDTKSLLQATGCLLYTSDAADE